MSEALRRTGSAARATTGAVRTGTRRTGGFVHRVTGASGAGLTGLSTLIELTAAGGLMIHSAPFTGWIDHGFYSFQPTFFFDLARANRYHVITFVIARLNPFRYAQLKSHDELPALLKSEALPPNTHINVVFRKPAESSEFKVATQGYYAGVLSAEAAKMWHENR